MNKDNKNISYSLSNNLNIFGFWLYLMSDCIIFSVLLIVYIVMSRHGYDGFLRKNNLFFPSIIFVKTLLLLFSSLTCGLAKIFYKLANKCGVLFFLFITFILGSIFLGIEYSDFIDIDNKGFHPSTNGYFSSLFTLLGVHGIHIIYGLLWVFVLFCQILYFGFLEFLGTSLFCLNLFWHFIDIIWILLMVCVYFK